MNLPFFGEISSRLQVYFLSMVPILELRAAIPYGILMGLPWYEAFIFAVLGNITPNFLLLWLLPKVGDWFRSHVSLFDRFVSRLHSENAHKFEKWGMTFVVTFIGVPIPGSGSWSGSVLCYLFGLNYRKSILVVILGVLMAGCIVLGISLGGFATIEAFFFGAR